jgi:amino-acid N-acetyltransferase
MSPGQKTMTIDSATVEDTQAIVSIFTANRSDPGLFQEPEAEVRRNLRDFMVARDANGNVVACLGLHQDSRELAEIYGVAVHPELQGKGIGAMLMRKCKEEAIASQIRHLWLATVKPEYFRRYSFRPISRWGLPRSVLLRKFRQVFQQPVQRWVPVLLGRHTFMKCNLLDEQGL